MLEGLEENALRDYEIAKRENDYQMVRRAQVKGLTRSDQRYRAMKVFNDTKLGRKLAWIAKEKRKNLKER